MGGPSEKAQSFKKSLPFTAPEMIDERYIELQMRLADAIGALYEDLTPAQ